MQIKEIHTHSILTKTRIPGYDYCINPYIGCAHGCRYCYASFMKRFTGHLEPWGDFVDVKVNARQRLRTQLEKARKGNVLIGTVTDPYQPAEKIYQITRGCLGLLLERQFPVNILTRSPLLLRDIDLFKEFNNIEVGFSIGTDDDKIRQIFERASPSTGLRIKALDTLHRTGIRTYVFIGPLLPLDPERLVESIAGSVDYVLIDRLNYPKKVLSLYRRLNMLGYAGYDYSSTTAHKLKALLDKRHIPASILFI